MPKIVALVALACALAAMPIINPRRACHAQLGTLLGGWPVRGHAVATGMQRAERKHRPGMALGSCFLEQPERGGGGDRHARVSCPDEPSAGRLEIARHTTALNQHSPRTCIAPPATPAPPISAIPAGMSGSASLP
jgi:hypothetical protein